MALLPPSEECMAVVMKEYGTSENRLKEDVNTLRQWLLMQPHLPHTFDDTTLQHFLLRSKNSIERSKQTIDMHYTLKAVLPEFFTMRDPLQQDLNFALNNTLLVPLPKPTRDGYRVVILKTLLKDGKYFDPEILFKMCFMIGDLRLAEDDTIGDIIVYDCEYLGMGHISKVTLPFLKKIEICSSKCYRARIKGVHFINAPPFVDVLLTMIKKVLRNKVAMRHHVHLTLESLYGHVDRDVLPVEYGGKEMRVTELAEEWRKKVIKSREWFVEQERSGKANEAKRPGKQFSTSELFGFEGTFKQLSVD